MTEAAFSFKQCNRNVTMKRVIAIILAVLLVLAIGYGCKTVRDYVVSARSAVQEEDTTSWADSTSEPLMIEGIADTSAKYAEARANGRLNLVFNGIWSRQTGYFTVPGGSLTITACGTAEGTQRFKVAVWKRVDGGAEYVDGSTGYFKTDGTNYRYTVTGLDPAASYRLTVSYDSSRYYLYGLLQAGGIGE